jgi:hypothetical protein
VNAESGVYDLFGDGVPGHSSPLRFSPRRKERMGRFGGEH